MKMMRRLVIFAGAIFASASVGAQTIQFINVTRQSNYVQTTDSSVNSGTLIADPTTPFVFKASIEGDNATTGTSPITAATVTLPNSTVQTLIFDSSGHQWGYKDVSQTSMANLNSAYGVGSYTFNITGSPSGTPAVTVGSFASSQLQAPILTLSGGTWVGGVYQMAVGSTLTVAFNPAYTGSVGSNASFHYDVELNGSGMGNPSDNNFLNWDPTANGGSGGAAAQASTPPNFVVNSMVAGNYNLQASFDDVQNFTNGLYGTAFAASLLEYHTNISLQVIPEPSVYAVILGAAALACIILRRRRQTALA